MRYLLFFFFIPQLLYAQPPPLLHAKEGLRQLTTEIMTLRDESGDKTLPEILLLKNNFTLGQQPFTAGYTHSVYWFRITLQRTADAQKNWLLSATPAYLNNLRLYLPNGNDDFTAIQAGTSVASALRPIDKQFGAFTFPVTINTTPTVFYLRLQQTHSASMLNLSIAKPAVLAGINSQHKLLLGLFSGGLLVLIVNTLLMWQNLPHLSYIMLIAYIANGVVLLMATDGTMAQYILPHQPGIITLLVPLGICLSILFFTLFVIFFFGTKYNFPRLHFVFLGLVALILLTIFSIPMGFFIDIAPVLALITLLLLPCNIYVSWMAARTGTIGGYSIGYGFLLYFIISIVFLLSLLGLISVSSIKLLNAQMSTLIILLFIGLYQRFQSIKKLQLEIETQIESAERKNSLEKQRNEEKSTFLSLVAHEAKIPIAVINSAIQVLDALPFEHNEITSERHSRIRKSISHLNSLLENTFSAERYENAPLQPRVTQVLLSPFIDQIINKTVIDQKRCRITVADDHYCSADHTLLDLALSNLLSNAVKYSPPDTVIQLTAKTAQYFDQNGTMISVSNTYLSEEEPDTTKWFTKYHRQNRQSHIEGLGLGLYLVKQMAEAHGGSLESITTPDLDHWLITINLWLPDTQKENYE